MLVKEATDGSAGSRASNPCKTAETLGQFDWSYSSIQFRTSLLPYKYIKKAVHKTYIQYKSSIRTDYDIMHHLHGNGNKNLLGACELHIRYSIYFHDIRGAMCILSNFVHKTTILGIHHIS